MNEKELTEIVRKGIDAEDAKEMQISESNIHITESGNSAVYYSGPNSEKVRVFPVAGDEVDDEIFEILKILTGDPDQLITEVRFQNKPGQLIMQVEGTSTTLKDRNPTRELVDYLISEA